MKVLSAEFIKNYGKLADKALQEPVTITRNGRDRLVLISSEEYDRLLRASTPNFFNKIIERLHQVRIRVIRRT